MFLIGVKLPFSVLLKGISHTCGDPEEFAPLVESIKDQHLLKPPPVMESSKFIVHTRI